MKRLKLKAFKNKNLNAQKEKTTQKILGQVLGTGPRRPRHCPVLAGVPGTIC